MKSVPNYKNNDSSYRQNSLIITDEIEYTESFAGVGNKSIVHLENDQKYTLNINNNINSVSSKSLKKHDTLCKKKFSVDINRKFNYPPNDIQNSLIKTIPTKKKVKSAKEKSRCHSFSNESDRLPPLISKETDNNGELKNNFSDVTIHNQIARIEHKKKKLTIKEKKDYMKELLKKGSKNWSVFKSEMDFIKSVEFRTDNPTHETEELIRDEKLLNIILNEIVVNEKENVKNNTFGLDIIENSLSVDDSKEKLIEDISDIYPEDIHFESVIKSTSKEYIYTKFSDNMAMDLKELLFNSFSRSWGSEWYKQNIQFQSIHDDMPFAIIQKHKGPNNIMAVIQAEFIINALFFKDTADDWIFHVKKNRNLILARTLGNIISRCRKLESDPCKICLLDLNLKGRSMGVIKPDGITECLVFCEIYKKEELIKFILHHIDQFTQLYCPGLILFLISSLLTYGISNYQSEHGYKNIRLISPLGIADDELMNFLIHGAVGSHYFNDKIGIIDPDSQQSIILQGISKRSHIGFLSLEKHCEHCQTIGTYLKTPKYPVWIVKWINNDYCIIFCQNRSLLNDWKAEIRFRLYLYSTSFKSPKMLSMIIDSSQKQLKNQKLEDINQKLEVEKKNQNITEQRLKTMSESTLKFLLDDCSIEDYLDNDNTNTATEDNRTYLERIIHVKWQNATVILDDDQINILDLF